MQCLAEAIRSCWLGKISGKDLMQVCRIAAQARKPVGNLEERVARMERTIRRQEAMRQQTRQKVEALEERAGIVEEPGEVLLDYRWSGPKPEDGRLAFRLPATEKSPARIIPREPGEADQDYQERAAQVCKAAQGRRIGKRDMPRLETFNGQRG